MTTYLLLLLLLAQIYKVSNLPSLLKRSSKEQPIAPLITNHAIEHNTIPIPKPRKKKGPTFALQYQHQYLIPNLHVIPLANGQHDNGNITHANLIPVFFPIHNLVPVHDLTVIPLHRVNEQKISYRANDEQDDDRFRNPLGGYGVGWRFGGHGAGHGFYYSYG